MEDYTNEESLPLSSIPDDIHLPLAILAVAFAVFLFSQISSLGQNSRSMRWQAENLDRQIASLTEGEKNLGQLVKQREALVEQSQQIQARFTEMFTDLIQLAESDSDARTVVEKYKIQRQQNQAAPKATPQANH